MKTSFEETFAALAATAEAYLQDCLVYPDEPQQKLFEAMRYSLLAGGKRLRMILCMEFCRICGGEPEKAMPFAAALEMVHTYSLIHDDLPCMDNDDFRRGKPTNHKVYGEAMAVLAGDGLLTSAFTQLASADLPAKQIVEAVGTLSECVGELGMVGGQVLDMQSEERELTRQEVLEIQSRKTGSLLSAACNLGAIAAGDNDAFVDAASRYAYSIGLAFQIRDDILDVIGDAGKLGKSVGTDAAKNTFVRLYGLEQCQTMVEEYTNAAVSALAQFGPDADFLRELARWLADRDH